MTTPPTPPADAVARLTAQMLDPWERVRCLPRCRSDEPMNHGECDCGSQQFVSDIRTLLAAYADAARDRERLDSEKKALRIGLRLRDEEAPEVRGRRISVSALFSELEMWLAESPRELVASRIHAQVDAMLDSMLPTEPRALPAARTGEAR